MLRCSGTSTLARAEESRVPSHIVEPNSYGYVDRTTEVCRIPSSSIGLHGLGDGALSDPPVTVRTFEDSKSLDF